MSREDPQLKIRLPAELKEQVEGAARAAGRTINAEVVLRLQQSYAPNAPGLADDASARGLAMRELRLIRAVTARAPLLSELQSLAVRLDVLQLREQQAPTPSERRAVHAEVDAVRERVATIRRSLKGIDKEVDEAEAGLAGAARTKVAKARPGV